MIKPMFGANGSGFVVVSLSGIQLDSERSRGKHCSVCMQLVFKRWVWMTSMKWVTLMKTIFGEGLDTKWWTKMCRNIYFFQIIIVFFIVFSDKRALEISIISYMHSFFMAVLMILILVKYQTESENSDLTSSVCSGASALYGWWLLH